MVISFSGVGQAKSDLIAQMEFKYLLKMGDHFFFHRAIPGNIEQSHQFYLNALELVPNHPDLFWRLSRNSWQLANRSQSSEKKISYYQEGIKYGEKSIRYADENPTSHLWYAISIGGFMLEKGIIETLYYKDLIKKELEITLEKNPEEYFALITLAYLNYKLPELVGGNKQKAYQYLSESKKIAPNFAHTYLYEAQFLLAEGKKQAAITELKKLLAIATPLDFSAGIEAKGSAREILTELEQQSNNTR